MRSTWLHELCCHHKSLLMAHVVVSFWWDISLNIAMKIYILFQSIFRWWFNGGPNDRHPTFYESNSNPQIWWTRCLTLGIGHPRATLLRYASEYKQFIFIFVSIRTWLHKRSHSTGCTCPNSTKFWESNMRPAWYCVAKYQFTTTWTLPSFQPRQHPCLIAYFADVTLSTDLQVWINV